MPLNKVDEPPDGGAGDDDEPLPESSRSAFPALAGNASQDPVRDIDVPAEAFPNILQGQRLLFMTPKQWRKVYHHAQDLVRNYYLASPVTRKFKHENRPENQDVFVLAIEAAFPVLKRCKENWGVRWIIKKAKHAVSVKFSHARREEGIQRANGAENARRASLDMRMWPPVTIEDAPGEGGSDDGSESSDEDVVTIDESDVKLEKVVQRGNLKEKLQYAARPHSTATYRPIQPLPQLINTGPGEDLSKKQQHAMRLQDYRPIQPLLNSSTQNTNPGPSHQFPGPSNAQPIPGLQSISEALRLSSAHMPIMLSACQVTGISNAMFRPSLQSIDEAPGFSSARMPNTSSAQQVTRVPIAQFRPNLEAICQIPRPSSTKLANLRSSHQPSEPSSTRYAGLGSDRQAHGLCSGQHMNLGPSRQTPGSSSTQIKSRLESTQEAAGPSSANRPSSHVITNLHASRPITSVYKRAFPYSQKRRRVVDSSKIASRAIISRPVLPPTRISIQEVPPAPVRRGVVPGLVLPSIAEILPTLGRVTRPLFSVRDQGRMACDAMLRESGPWLTGGRRPGRFVWKSKATLGDTGVGAARSWRR